jgi:hypothetical protein
VLGSTAGMTTMKVVSDPEGANVVSGCMGGVVHNRASSVPPLALSLKLDMAEENNGSMANNAKEHKTSGGESSIVGESSLA